MKDIRDCKGRIACKGDVVTGLVEIAYKHFMTSTQLPIGGTIKIEREGVITIVTRASTKAFDIESHPCAA